MRHAYLVIALALCNFVHDTHTASWCPETFYCDPEKKRVTDVRYVCCATYKKDEPQAYADSIKSPTRKHIKEAAKSGPYSSCFNDLCVCHRALIDDDVSDDDEDLDPHDTFCYAMPTGFAINGIASSGFNILSPGCGLASLCGLFCTCNMLATKNITGIREKNTQAIEKALKMK